MSHIPLLLYTLAVMFVGIYVGRRYERQDRMADLLSVTMTGIRAGREIERLEHVQARTPENVNCN